MANTYDKPDDIRLTGTFTDSAGDAQDPTAAFISVKKPDGTYVSYKTGTGWSDQGNWSASANSPTLANGTGTAGQFYTSTTAGSVDFGDGSITFAVDDQVFYTGDIWEIIRSPSSTTLTKSSTGVYYVDQVVGQSGKWYYRAAAAGTGTSGAESWLNVRTSQF